MKFISMFAAAVMSLTGATSTPAVVPQHCVNLTKVLTLGSSNPEVMQLQIFLGVKPSGFFGPLTQSALIKWQLQNKIIVTAKSAGGGTTGPKTRSAMKCSTTVNPPAPLQATSSFIVPKLPVATTTTPAPIPLPFSGGGGAAPSAPKCAQFSTPQPAANTCTTGAWFLGRDEAGCPQEWICDDPNALY